MYTFFKSITGLISGWKHGRGVIYLNETILKNKYIGALLAVAAPYAYDRGFFPLAFCVVDGEKDASW